MARRSKTRTPARAASKKAKAAPRKRGEPAKLKRPLKPAKPRLLSGGNPQIAKAHGDAPVRAYIAAIPGWKQDIARRLDALIERTVPDVSRAVKWNSPLYGQDGASWFLSMHCFARYVKVTFFRGASLKPPPPGPSKQPGVRYLDIHEDGWGRDFEEAQLADWIRQAARLPGERL